MPYLVLARHATAVKAAAVPVDDFDRPLTEAGFAEAAAAGEFLAGLPLEHCVASAALRTVQTGEAVIEAAARRGTEPRLLTDSALYDSDVDAWLEAISVIPAAAAGAYLVGHEPTVSEVIGVLCSDLGVPERFRPSSVAVFDLPSWGAEVGRFPVPEIRNFK